MCGCRRANDKGSSLGLVVVGWKYLRNETGRGAAPAPFCVGRLVRRSSLQRGVRRSFGRVDAVAVGAPRGYGAQKRGHGRPSNCFGRRDMTSASWSWEEIGRTPS
jgi:hypothetical protein